jgi:hypothetical protein
MIASPPAISCSRRLCIGPDGDLLLHALEREHDDVPVIAGAQAYIGQPARLKPRKFHANFIAAGRQPTSRRKGLPRSLDRIDDRRARRIVNPGHRDRGIGNDGFDRRPSPEPGRRAVSGRTKESPGDKRAG